MLNMPKKKGSTMAATGTTSRANNPPRSFRRATAPITPKGPPTKTAIPNQNWFSVQTVESKRPNSRPMP